jgi:type I restriction enzyme S subunit
MTLDTFIEKFDLFADAPDAVGKMRELVLELAVQGKLVNQDPDEGDGVDLLKLIHQKKPLAKAKVDGEAVDLDLADLPRNWAPSKLGEVAEIIRGVSFPGGAKSETRSDGDVACLRTASVQAEIDWDDMIYISPTYVSRPDQWVEPDDIIISMANSYALVGKVAIVREVPQKATFGAFLAAIRPILIEPYFLLYVLRSPRMQAAFRASSSQTTNIANISLGRMRPLPFPLPPLAEQKRIVAKVDELMALCDRLEAQQQEREQQHTALSRASLARFADAPTPANLQLLFHKSYTISPADLRKSILTLAVQGKLVAQDPGDEPPQLPDGAQNIEDSEWVSRLQLPALWNWTRLESILAILKNGFNGKPSKVPGKFKVTRIETIARETIDLTRVGYADDLPGDIVAKHAISKGDILFSHINSEPHLGKTAICTIDDPMLIHGVNLLLIRPIAGVDSRYLNIAFRELRASSYFVSIAQRAVNQASINQKNLGKTAIPIPPLAEQRRIAAKVDQLMAMVDAMETQLAASRATAKNLLDSLVAVLTNGSQKAS